MLCLACFSSMITNRGLNLFAKIAHFFNQCNNHIQKKSPDRCLIGRGIFIYYHPIIEPYFFFAALRLAGAAFFGAALGSASTSFRQSS